MDVTILQAIQISVWCLFTLRETVIISKTTHIKEKGATASGFTPLGTHIKEKGATASGFTPLGSLLGTSLVFRLIRTADIDDHRVFMGVDPFA